MSERRLCQKSRDILGLFNNNARQVRGVAAQLPFQGSGTWLERADSRVEVPSDRALDEASDLNSN